MLKKFTFLIIGVALLASMMGCNSKSSTYNTEFTYSSTLVKSFGLAANKNLLASLDTVFFSIDQMNARIFNADSLPYGTNISKLQLRIVTDGCSKVELNVPQSNGGDLLVDYLTNSTDSIDFSNGPVMLHVVSYDGAAERNYQIKVNVHQIVPDSLTWDKLAMRPLPGLIANTTEQKTVKQSNTVICLTTDGADYCISTTDTPASDEWASQIVTMPFTPVVNSLAATDNALFILADDGALYQSTDKGANWTSTGETWQAIIGNFQDKLLGLKLNASGMSHVTYPASGETPAKAGFPMEGFSNLVTVNTIWSDTPQVFILGGVTSSGDRSRALWGFDGANWAKLSETFPVEIEGVTILPYDVAKTDTLTWTVTEMPCLLAIGGETADGLSAKTYISRDLGLNWKAADKLLTLPDYISPRKYAQALVFNSTITDARSASLWQPYPSNPLPGWWTPLTAQASRAIAPITEWECPYIYLFGGIDEQGLLCNSIWRGVINRLMFKPLQ